MYGLGVLDCPVRPVFSEASGVVEEACCNGLLDGVVITQVAD